MTAAVITLSDRCFAGVHIDTSGPAIAEKLKEAGYQVIETVLLPDESEGLQKELIHLADECEVNLILTTGGTGFSPRDITPEATMAVAERNAPGIAEAIRAYSVSITPKGMLSRGNSVLRGNTLIINLPGSRKAVVEIMEYLLPILPHALEVLSGTGDE